MKNNKYKLSYMLKNGINPVSGFKPDIIKEDYESNNNTKNQ